MKKLSESEIRELKEQLEVLGIRIVDVRSYPSTLAFPDRPTEITILVGYVPGKACIIDVDVTGHDFKFNIRGQVKSCTYEGDYHFRGLHRSAVSSESFGGGQFHINHFTGYNSRDRSIREKMTIGASFFQKFLRLYGHTLEDRFTQGIHLWFVPEYSDELFRMTGPDNKFSPAAYEHFNARVLAKFPEGFLATDQNP